MPQLPIVTDCNGCGACCFQLGSPPFFASAQDLARAGPDWSRLPEHLKNEVLVSMPRDSGPCSWLDADTKKCRHYEFR
ncbi:MAG: YkgJ family cysteine cluster protein, partial [Planctomycetes bacterium]|nr:YkgJ family cysteine cluster protein [Planctomycetota bacterium]